MNDKNTVTPAAALPRYRCHKTVQGWIGVDLDGTLAHGFGFGYVGAPVRPMVARVHAWLEEGRDVRIVTARVASSTPSDLVDEARRAIDAWCLTHLRRTLPITAEKDFGMLELWDDRAVQVVANTGELATERAMRSGAGEAVNEALPPLRSRHSLFVAALEEPAADHAEPLHCRVERECWHQHPANFIDCEQPACVLLKRLARALGWTVDTNGVRP